MKNLANPNPMRSLGEPCRKCGAAPSENCKHSNSKENDVKPDEKAPAWIEEAQK
jgi:hypothetical protein